jgi:GAF domain-containing protein
MEISKGRKISGQTVRLDELHFASKVNEAIKNKSYIHIPRMPLQSEGEKIGSAIISPIVCENECFGALYADSSLDHEHYSLEDLDYLILVSFMAGAFIKNL